MSAARFRHAAVLAALPATCFAASTACERPSAKDRIVSMENRLVELEAACELFKARAAEAEAATLKARRSYGEYDIGGQVVFITGATAGIGEACAWQFAERGCKLVITGRREQRLLALKEAINKQHPDVKIHLLKLDVTNMSEVTSVPSQLPAEFRDVQILVNNAGLALGLNSADKMPIGDIEAMINTNVIGLMAMTTTITKGMKERQSGHVINIGSISSHFSYGGGSVYVASKFAVDGYTQSVRQDMVETPIRVSMVSPGMVSTEFSQVRFKGDTSRADSVYDGIECLTAEDIADHVVYTATRPPHVQVGELLVWPTNQVQGKVVRAGVSLGRK